MPFYSEHEREASVSRSRGASLLFRARCTACSCVSQRCYYSRYAVRRRAVVYIAIMARDPCQPSPWHSCLLPSLYFSPPFLWPPLLLANPPFNPAFPALDPIPVPVPLPPAPLPPYHLFRSLRHRGTNYGGYMSAEGDILFVPCTRTYARTCRNGYCRCRRRRCPHRDRYSRDAFYSGDEAYRALLYRASFSASKARFSSLARFLFTLFLFFFSFFLSLRKKHRVSGRITDPSESHFRLKRASIFHVPIASLTQPLLLGQHDALGMSQNK